MNSRSVTFTEQTPLPPRLSDSEEYDTDLEDEAEDEQVVKARRQEEARVGEQTYLRACARYHAPPQQAVLDCLDSRHISLPHRNIGPLGARALARALKSNTEVLSLDLEDNGVGGSGATFLADMLLKNYHITHLNLSGNQLATKGAIAIGEMLKYNTTLLTLDISENMFSDSDGQYLAVGLEKNDRLDILNLSKNDLSEEGAAFVGKAIGESGSLERVDLSWNCVRRSGALALCKALQDNVLLTHLDLSHNGLGYEGALALGELIRVNHYLTEVDASQNRINWQGAFLISQGLRQNETLQILQLGGNPLTTTGCMDIIEAISSRNSAIERLDLQGIPVIGEFEMMAAAIKQTRKFDYVHGGIVPTHDILGQRLGKRIDPMQKVINYMRDRELRPTELFRSFDKSVQNKLTNKDFLRRIQKMLQGTGIPIHNWELDELLDQIEGSNRGKADRGVIDYKKLVDGVNDQIEKERVEKIKVREKQLALDRYHKRILDINLPPIQDEGPLTDDEGGQARSIASAVMMTRSQSVPRNLGTSKVKPLLSMSTSLGAKAKAFGEAGAKKKKRGKKKGKKKGKRK